MVFQVLFNQYVDHLEPSWSFATPARVSAAVGLVIIIVALTRA